MYNKTDVLAGELILSYRRLRRLSKDLEKTVKNLIEELTVKGVLNKGNILKELSTLQDNPLLAEMRECYIPTEDNE